MGTISITDFADKMSELMPVIFREFARRQNDALYKGSITLPQFLILDCLMRQGETKMTELAKTMRVTMAAMTGLVQRLVKSGYVIRLSDPRDRRIVKVKVIIKGIDLVKKVCEQKRVLTIKVFEKLTETERENYLNIMTRIKDILCSTEEKK